MIKIIKIDYLKYLLLKNIIILLKKMNLIEKKKIIINQIWVIVR